MIETAAPELHDAILLCVGVAAVYLVVTVLQLMQLKRHRPAVIVGREPSLGNQAPLNVDASPPDDLSFPHQLKQTSLENGLKRLDLEVEHLQRELHATQDELMRLRKERDIQHVTPLYNEAMSLAKSGLSAVGIASRCGISMGEADLVTALARNPKDYSSAADALERSPMVSEYHKQQYDRFRAAA